mgnify:CR=1 FL=1
MMISMSDQELFEKLHKQIRKADPKYDQHVKRRFRTRLAFGVEQKDVRWQKDGEQTADKLRKAHGRALINKAKSYTGGGRKAPSPMGHYDLLKRKLVRANKKKRNEQIG